MPSASRSKDEGEENDYDDEQSGSDADHDDQNGNQQDTVNQAKEAASSRRRRRKANKKKNPDADPVKVNTHELASPPPEACLPAKVHITKADLGEQPPNKCCEGAACC